MRRWGALAAAVLTVSVPAAAVPAAAQAGPPDPVRVLTSQLRPERGVQISEVARTVFDKTPTMFRANGRLQLGPSGPVAFDATWQQVPDPKTRREVESGVDRSLASRMYDPYDITVVQGSIYVSGSIYDGALPEGKTWVRAELPREFKVNPVTISHLASRQAINVFEPTVLKTLLKGSTGKPVSGGFLYQGTVNYAELYKVYKSIYADALRGRRADGKELGKRKIAWRLWTDGEGRLQRLVSTETTGRRELSMTSSIDTRYTGWGSQVVVVAPPADQVIDEKDLPRGVSMTPEPKELVNTLSAPSRDN
ncbi:hypothetical protein [Streptosporangium sp. NPDC000396]|uniref:hypothetical protein n=1 Tax=Streptosporangium sp. NPDC000396 TaxID=3366185 RepID=UPI0036CA8EC4